MFAFRLFCLCLALFVALPPAVAAPPTNGWALVWNDEFDGTKLDTSKWGYWLTGARRDATNTPTAVSVGGGAVTISTYTSGGTHYTGMISTSNTYLPAYGYIEARINYDSSPGMWSAFWLQSPTMGNPIGDAQTAGTEIDVCEHRAVDGGNADISNRIVGNIHWDGYGASHRSVGYDSGNLGLASGYHIYGFEWTPTTQRFYIDGVLRWTVNNGTNSPVSQRSEFIILSSEIENAGWAGTIPAAGYGSVLTTTTKMVVDYVRVYQRAETAVNGDFEARLAPFGAFNQGSWSSTGGRSGAAAKIAPTSGSGASVEQTIRGLLPATDYVLTAWGNAGTVSPSLFLGAKNYGGAQVGDTITSSSYTKATVPFTTGATNRSAAVFAFAGTSGMVAYADDFLLRRAATVTNGGLEAGEFAPWTYYGGTAVSSDGNNYGGNYALRIPSSASSAGAEQEIVGLAPGTTYRLSGWTTNGGQGLTLGVKNHGGSQVSTNVLASAWTRGTVNFTTGASNTTATIFAFRGSSSATSYADSFFLYQPLAAPWASQDVTAIPLAGAAGRLGDRFVIQAAGADIWGTSDKFHFVSQQLTGDGQITARILGLDNTSAAAKTGVMMRETLNSFARSVMVDWTPGQTVELIRRTTSSGSSSADVVGDVTNPPWVRLARRGNVFTGYYSTDGVNWTRVGAPVTIAMPSTIYVGLPACSHDDTMLTEAVLDNVSIAQPPPDVSITSAADGVTLPGTATPLRVAAAVADIGTQGTPVVAWTRVSGPGSVTFANSALADTSASFSATGTYVLQCAATTAAGTGAERITVNVIASPDAQRVLWLKLDESSGAVAADGSGSGNTGTVNGGVTWQPAGGKLRGAAQFNGTDSYVNVPDVAALDNTSAFTLSYWFKVNTINGAGHVAKRNNFNDNNAYSVFLQTDARLNVDIDSNNDRFTSNTAFATGIWYHVAVVFDGTLAAASRARLYVNGVLDVVSSETSSTVPNYNSSFKVGVLHVGSAVMDGLVDDVRFYRRALPASEVAAIAGGIFAPTVAAGSAPAATNGITANLTGSASNDISGTLTTAWSKFSGPGSATFGNAASTATTVTFNQPGAYVLRLTATNSAAQDFSEMTVNVAANPNIFADWQSLTWPGVSDVNIIGPLADPDLDGMKNIIEYALGMNAKVAGSGGLPTSLWRNVGGSDYLALQVRRPIGRTGITYSAEVSGDLLNPLWAAAVQDGAAVNNGDGTETAIFRDTVPRGVAPRFIRLKITQP
jgi:beta-glucanase (GH16 family)